MQQNEKYNIVLDLDRDRIRTVLRETYRICRDTLNVEFMFPEDQFVDKINIFLDSNRVSTPVTLALPSKQFPEMRIEVNLRQKSVFARMVDAKKQAFINRYLVAL